MSRDIGNIRWLLSCGAESPCGTKWHHTHHATQPNMRHLDSVFLRWFRLVWSCLEGVP